MSLCKCPRCHDEISLPLRGRPHSRVKCPLCYEEMLLEEVLAKMPPALILLDEEEEPAPSEWVSTSAETDDSPGLAKPVFMGSAVANATDMGEIASSVAASPPRPRRQPNVLMEMVKIVLGGVVGIGLAIIAIWHIAKTDPFNLGPVVAKYVPMIVPEKFHGKKSVSEVTEPPPVNPQPPKVKPPQPMDPVEPIDPTTPKPGNGLQVDSKFEDILNGKTPPADPKDPLALDPNDPLNNLKPEIDTPVDQPEAKRFSGADLQKELQTAMAALEAYEESDKNDKAGRQRLAMQLFAAAGPVGFVAAQVDPRDADVEAVTPAIKEYLTKLTATAAKRSILGYLTSLRIDAGDGIVFPGTVKKHAAVGDLFETELELVLASGPRSLTIVSRNNPQDIAAVDDKVVVLGSVVREPKKIKGYRGAAEMVILSGHIQKLD